jgi:hypothetical protein
LQSTGGNAVIDVCIDIIFGIDLVMAFRTAYFTDQRQLIYDGQSVAKHYIKSWFFIDFVTTVPIDRIAKSFVSENGGALRVVKILRVLRLFRLAKLMKILQNGPLFEKFEDLTRSVNPSVFNLLSLFAQLLFAAHLIGCIWHGVTFLQPEESWVSDYFSAGDDELASTKYLARYWLEPRPQMLIVSTLPLSTYCYFSR